MTQIKTLYFSGGGTRGMAFVGAIKALEEYDILNDIDTLIGVSIGSMMAAAVSFNIPWKNLKASFMTFNVTTCANIEVEHILDKFGLDNGKKFMTIFLKIMKKYAGSTTMTFKEHYEKTGKRLIISSACVNDQSTHYFDYQNTPNLKIVKAVRMSISLPFFFTTHKFNKKHYVDGSTYEHYPISIFGNPENFLGINITRSKINTFIPINDITTFITHIIGGCRSQIGRMQRKLVNQYNYTMIDIISDDPIFDFENKKSLKIKLFQNGYDNAKKIIINNILNKQNKIIKKNNIELRITNLETKLDTIIELLNNISPKSFNNNNINLIKSVKDTINTEETELNESIKIIDIEENQIDIKSDKNELESNDISLN
jgi:predicted acylesterase/phospholipase RssA